MQSPTSSLRHRLGHRHLPLEAQISRHLEVAIPEGAVSDIVAMRACQDGAESQQPDFVQHEPGVSRHGCQPVDSGLRPLASSSPPRCSSASTNTLAASTIHSEPPESKESLTAARDSSIAPPKSHDRAFSCAMTASRNGPVLLVIRFSKER